MLRKLPFRSASWRLVLVVLALGWAADASADSVKYGRSGQAYRWVRGSC